jgi:hypothetical protein
MATSIRIFLTHYYHYLHYNTHLTYIRLTRSGKINQGTNLSRHKQAGWLDGLSNITNLEVAFVSGGGGRQKHLDWQVKIETSCHFA